MRHTVELEGITMDSERRWAERFNVHQQTIIRWRKTGKLTGGIKIGGTWYYPRAATEALLLRPIDKEE